MTLSTATTDFVAAQRVNRRNTFLLLAILTLLAASLGYLIGWVLSFDDAAPGPWSGGGVIGAGLMAAASIGWSLISLATSDRMVLGMASAKDIDKADAPQLFNVVEEMSIAAGVPMPRVMVIETDALNAFATGPSVQRGTIVVTRGLLKALSEEVAAQHSRFFESLLGIDPQTLMQDRQGRPFPIAGEGHVRSELLA